MKFKLYFNLVGIACLFIAIPMIYLLPSCEASEEYEVESIVPDANSTKNSKIEFIEILTKNNEIYLLVNKFFYRISDITVYSILKPSGEKEYLHGKDEFIKFFQDKGLSEEEVLAYR